jgi:hypothetical protein
MIVILTATITQTEYRLEFSSFRLERSSFTQRPYKSETEAPDRVECRTEMHFTLCKGNHNLSICKISHLFLSMMGSGVISY